MVGEAADTFGWRTAFAVATLPRTAWLQKRLLGKPFDGFVKAAVMVVWFTVLIEQGGGFFNILILLASLTLCSD